MKRRFFGNYFLPKQQILNCMCRNGHRLKVFTKVLKSDGILNVLLIIARLWSLNVPRFYGCPNFKLFILVGWGWRFFVCCLADRSSTGDSLLLQIFSGVVWLPSDLQLPSSTLYLSSPRLSFFMVLYVIYLFTVMIHRLKTEL